MNAAQLRSALDSSRRPITPRAFNVQELQNLPPPVRRYFQAVLADGQPMVAAVTMAHQGTMDMRASGDASWKPFTSTQHVVLRRPGFVWDARVRMLPGLPVRVLDAYVAGQGHLHAALWGLFPVADAHGTRNIASGELMRWLAEAAWYPTALLPSQGVHWEAVDDRSAYATLADAGLTVRLLFRFHADGTIDTVRAQARARTVGGTVTMTPWQGRFWNMAERGGMQVPLDGEVGWVLPQGLRLYFRATVTALDYAFAA